MLQIRRSASELPEGSPRALMRRMSAAANISTEERKSNFLSFDLPAPTAPNTPLKAKKQTSLLMESQNDIYAAETSIKSKSDKSKDAVSDKRSLSSNASGNKSKSTKKRPASRQSSNSSIPKEKKTCWHYERKCRLKCETCQTFYPCRICHDMRNYNEQNAKIKPS